MRPPVLKRFAIVCAASAASIAAQGQAYPPAGLPPSVAFTSIVHAPATETTFTLDRSMLAAADGFFNGQDPAGRQVAAGLNSITVHNYHYRDGAAYDPGAFAALDGDFRLAGYQHLVNANAHGGPSTTDLWLRFAGPNVNSMVVLTRGDRNMSAIVVDCTLRPLDLLHLSGHFGIPQVSPGAVMVPAQPPAGAVMVPAAPIERQGSQAQSQTMTNPPTLKRHSPDDPQ